MDGRISFFTSFQHWRCKNLTAHKHHTRWGGTCLRSGEWDLQSSSEGAYLQTDMQRAPQAADPSRLLIRLALWAGESQGRRRITRWASKVKRGYPGGWATWRGDDRWWEFRAWGAWMTVSWLVYNRYFLVCLSRWVCSSCCTNVERQTLAAMTAKWLSHQSLLSLFPSLFCLLFLWPLPKDSLSPSRRKRSTWCFASRRPPNHLRAAAILAWGISAITAISH